MAGSTQEANPLEGVAWTNLARIGYARGNPESAALRVEPEVHRWLLAVELEWLRPEVVVPAIGNYQHRFVAGFSDEAE